MRRFLIATHGRFATGIMDSVNLISGRHENVECYCAFLNGCEDLDTNLAAILDSYGPQDEVIAVTDLLGGSVCSALLRQLSRPNLHVLAGLNLPLMLALLDAEDAPLDEMLGTALQFGKQAVCYCNEAMKQTVEEDAF